MKILKWVGFLAIGLVIGFMGAFLFVDTDDVAKEDTNQEEVTNETESTDTSGEEADDSSEAAQANGDNIFVQKNCIQCHDVSPLGIKGNGTGPDLAIAYEDVEKRFGKSLEEFLDEPEGTMSAIFAQSPLTDEEKDEVIDLLKSYAE